MLIKLNQLPVIFLCAFLVGGCASVEKDFEAAVENDSIPTYRSFISRHSRSGYTEQARKRIEELEELELAKTKRQEEAKNNAWVLAKSSASIELLSEYLETYPESDHADEARERIRKIIMTQVKSNTSGRRNPIRNGNNFPLNLFNTDDIIRGFGGLKVGFFIKAKTGQAVEQEMGYQDFADYQEWLHFYHKAIAKINGLRSAQADFDLRMATISHVAKSSLKPEISVTFYRDPEYNTSKTLRLSVQRVFSYGDLLEEKVVLKGVGFAILNKGGTTEVYEFTKDGFSTEHAN